MRALFFKVILFTGSVHSRSVRDVFESFFGGVSNSENDNSIPYDDEDNWNKLKETDQVNNNIDHEDNEIPLTFVNPYTHKKEADPADNRVGYTYKTKSDPRTDKGYQDLLNKLSFYLKRFENQDHGYGLGSAGYAYAAWEWLVHDELK